MEDLEVSKNNDIDARIAKIERLTQEIGELVEKSGVRSRQEGDTWGDGGLTREKQQELVEKQEELERLKKEDDEAQGII